MKMYYTAIDVRFSKPQLAKSVSKAMIVDPDHDAKEYVLGFGQGIGCTAKDIDALKMLVETFVYTNDFDAESKIIYDEIDEVDLDDIYEDEDIKDSLKQDPSKEGIWYATGRGFYDDEDEEE